MWPNLNIAVSRVSDKQERIKILTQKGNLNIYQLAEYFSTDENLLNAIKAIFSWLTGYYELYMLIDFMKYFSSETYRYKFLKLAKLHCTGEVDRTKISKYFIDEKYLKLV